MDRIDWTAVERLIDLALAEDLGAGDITTDGIVSARARGTGQVTAKQTCVVSGLFLAERVYRRLDPDVKVELLVAEGKRVTSGTVLCRITGQFRALLAGERTVLNFLQRQCGIATLTHRFVRKVSRTKARIYDTRKTAPGMRTLDKYAVRTGGGCNHRMGLYDAILIKENHIAAAGGVDRAIARARKAHPDVVLEVEVRNFEELVLAVEYGADVVLLDNMEPGDVRKAAGLVGNRVELEVSGGVTLANVLAAAQNGVARISIGALTHSAPAADLSMLIVPNKG